MFGTVWKYIRRSPYQALIATIIMAFTFYMVSIFALGTIISINLIRHFEQSPQLTVFFRDEATEDTIVEMKRQLEATGKTMSVTYISKEDALKIYKQQNSADPILLDLVTPEILPASLEVKAYTAADLGSLAQIATESDLVENVAYQQEIIDRLLSWINALRMVGIAMIAVLIVESILVIITIISFKIVRKREEIETMRLIGASNTFIRIPFVLEGIIYGVIGALVGWAISVSLLLYFSPQLASFFKGIPVFPIQPMLLVGLLMGELAFAMVLGIFASLVAVKRYLK